MNAVRYMCSQLVTLSWDAGSWDAGGVIVNLEEIREGGCALESEIEVPPDAVVEIRCGEACFAGKIAACAESGFGWRLEVEFSPATPWSLERFRPEHLLDLEALAAAAGNETT